jgi:hypothetical protein
LQKDLAPVRSASETPDKTPELEAVDELNCAVMLDLQPFGQHSDGCFPEFRQAPECQQSLMLLRFEPGRARGLFAEIQEAPDLVPKSGERLIIERVARLLMHPAQLYRIPT